MVKEHIKKHPVKNGIIVFKKEKKTWALSNVSNQHKCTADLHRDKSLDKSKNIHLNIKNREMEHMENSFGSYIQCLIHESRGLQAWV